MTQGFFNEPEEQSLVKAEIVVGYFEAWSRIMAKRSARVGYFDFFAGPGRYQSGEKSVPLLILERAIASPDLRSRLVSVFNDANPSFTGALADEIKSLPGIETLKYQPVILTGDVGDEIVEHFEKTKTIPALSFIDPWGYKGLSLRLIRSVVKDWGCEVVFFFNYNRINMGVNNPIIEDHMAALLGTGGLAELREQCKGYSPEEREHAIQLALGRALEEMGAPFLIPFRFKRAGGRVSHYICFVSKDKLGYKIMKEIMADRGIVDEDGVPLFEYLPKTSGQQLRFDTPRPLLSLSADLANRFAGQTITMKDIYDKHHVGTPFIGRNYKQVLIQMEMDGLVTCDRPAAKRKPNTFGDDRYATFAE